jgi:CTP-dependent riboflavin kinase
MGRGVAFAGTMKVLAGIIQPHGFGYATSNLAPVMGLIEKRIGLADLQPGTLNVKIDEEYIVISDAIISPNEYPLNRQSGLQETIKLQRCLVNGIKAIIMRPDTHENIPGFGHGKNCLELMSPIHFQRTLQLRDGDEVEVQLEGDDAWWNSGS